MLKIKWILKKISGLPSESDTQEQYFSLLDENSESFYHTYVPIFVN